MLGGVPTADDFRALARSSPERWSTLRFTARWRGPWVPSEPVRAWLRRPDRLRVETTAGALVEVLREPSTPAPTRSGTADDPMYVNYSWVAMLDPYELADGLDDEAPGAGITGAGVPGAEVEALREVEHAGRPAWEAFLRPTDSYEPRCGCCSLLRSPHIDELEWGGPQLAVYPEATRVRLDVGTGVCVLTEALGGSASGAGHDVGIEAVDEPMGEELFVAPRRRPLLREGWSPLPGEAGPQ